LEACKEWDEEGQELIGDAIAELGEAAVPELLRTMDEPDEDVRETAIYALQTLGPDALDGLIKVFKEGSEEVRGRAAVLLVRLDDDATEPLALILKHGPDKARPLASVVLQEIGINAVDDLVAILDGTKEGREWARFDLLAIGGQSVAAATSVTDATVGLLKNKMLEVREVAVQCVGKFGGAAAVPKVIDALCDDDDHIRLSAAKCASLI